MTWSLLSSAGVCGSAARRAHLAVVVAIMLLAAACSGSQGSDSGTDADVSSSCETSATQIVDRFDDFLAPYSDLSPEEFLAADLEGLADFQNDIAETVVSVATDPNDNCTERDLETQVDRALEQYAGEGTLNQYLVRLVRQGVQVETRDVVVSPDDDLIAILAALGPGSSVTFTEGVFTLDASILIQGDLVLVGAGSDETILESPADTAAIAVLGGGSMVMNNFTVRHIGDLPASVVVAVDSSIELVNMVISGGVIDAEGGGGSGIVLTETEQVTTPPVVAIDQSVVSNNAAAGIAVTGTVAPLILNTVIESNVQCGICFFDSSAGQVQSSTLEGNGVGAQVSNSASPELSLNTFLTNQVAGLLIEDTSMATVISNDFDAPETVAIDVQGTAAPVLQRNSIGAHAVGISLREESTASVSNNTITGADVGVLVGGSATPVVFENEVDNSQIAGMLHTETSVGDFTANQVTSESGAGIVVEGSASPQHVDVVVDGGLVGVVFREMSSGLLRGASLSAQQVGLEANDQSSPTIETSTIDDASDAGAILSGETMAVFRQNRVNSPASIGIQTSGASTPVIEGNQVANGDTALLVTESSVPQIIDNVLTDQNFGIGVSDQAAPVIEGNQIQNAAAGAMSFEGESAGTVQNNMITDAGVVGIRVAGSASPWLEDNSLFAIVVLGDDAPTDAAADGDADGGDAANTDGAGAAADGDADGAGAAADGDAVGGDAADTDGAGAAADGDAEGTQDAGGTDDAAGTDGADVVGSGAGLLYAEQAEGTAIGNQLFGFVIGIQVSDQATPIVQTNRVDGAGIGGVGILYGAAGAGTAEGNISINQQLGFQLSGTTAPELTDNTVENAAVAGFLIQGESTAALTGNGCVGGAPGIVVLESAVPVLTENDCTIQ